MTKQTLTCSAKIFGAAFSFVSVLLFAMCSRTTGNANAGFLGTWKGTDCGGSATYVITESEIPMPSGIQIAVWFGNGSCKNRAEGQGTVSGNNFTCYSQGFTDFCGNNYTTNVTGNLKGNTLTMSNAIIDSLGTFSCAFTGTKQ